MKILKPSIKIKPQVQTSTPTNSDSTIMDDTVMTMDGLGLMGGQVTIQPAMRSKIKPLVPRLKPRIRR
jgi:hypothetical protein